MVRASSAGGGAVKSAACLAANDIELQPDPEAAYRASVSMHYPNSDDLTMAVRVKLMALRDRAALALNRCCPEAAPTLAEASRIATLAALSTAPTRSLACVAVAVESLIFSAQMLQRASA